MALARALRTQQFGLRFADRMLRNLGTPIHCFEQLSRASFLRSSLTSTTPSAQDLAPSRFDLRRGQARYGVVPKRRAPCAKGNVAIVGDNSNAFVQVGDGAIVVSEGADDGWAWVFWPQHGEFANTTNFVVSPNSIDVMEFASTPHRIDEVAVFSDGIENLVLHAASRTVHAPFFDAMFPPVRQHLPGFAVDLSLGLEKYLLSPRICDRTDDDKTLVLATRRTIVPVQDTPDERPA